MEHEYLVSFGLLGDFGRFRPARPVSCRRGDAVVVRSHRGIEIGQILRPAGASHARFLPNTSVGTLLRLATVDDERTAEAGRRRGRALFDDARAKADELGLSLELIDAEVLLDNAHAVLHYVRWQDCDVRPLVSALSKQFTLHVLLEDLTRTEPAVTEADGHGCGSCSSGSCGSGGCGSGGCGTCGSAPKEEVRSYFAELREKMARADRTPLL